MCTGNDNALDWVKGTGKGTGIGGIIEVIYATSLICIDEGTKVHYRHLLSKLGTESSLHTRQGWMFTCIYDWLWCNDANQINEEGRQGLQRMWRIKVTPRIPVWEVGRISTLPRWGKLVREVVFMWRRARVWIWMLSCWRNICAAHTHGQFQSCVSRLGQE